MSFISIDPSSGQILNRYPLASPEEVEQALTSAQSAHLAWRSRPIEERIAPLRALGRLVREGREQADHAGSRRSGEVRLGV
jgi:acyl-CoA reductase-like NAD-dependent aldehyde dehydrogenase